MLFTKQIRNSTIAIVLFIKKFIFFLKYRTSFYSFMYCTLVNLEMFNTGDPDSKLKGAVPSIGIAIIGFLFTGIKPLVEAEILAFVSSDSVFPFLASDILAFEAAECVSPLKGDLASLDWLYGQKNKFKNSFSSWRISVASSQKHKISNVKLHLPCFNIAREMVLSAFSNSISE